MKKFIILSLASIISLINVYTQDNFGYLNNERCYFEISSNEVIVKVDRKMSENYIAKSFHKHTSLQVSEIYGDNIDFKVVRFSNATPNAIRQLADQWISNDTILFVGQVIIDEFGRNSSALTDQITVMLKDENDFPILLEAVASYNIDKIVQCEINSVRHMLFVNYFSEKSALQIANELYETALFNYTESNLLLFIIYG